MVDTSAVNVDTPGTYVVTYDVTDASGNAAHAERTVDVTASNTPSLPISPWAMIVLTVFLGVIGFRAKARVR